LPGTPWGVQFFPTFRILKEILALVSEKRRIVSVIEGRECLKVWMNDYQKRSSRHKFCSAYMQFLSTVQHLNFLFDLILYTSINIVLAFQNKIYFH